MDQNSPYQMTPPPMPAGMPPISNMPDHNGHKKIGPIVAITVIVLVLILAAIYIFASRVNQQALPLDSTTALNTEGTSASPSNQQVQSASAPVSSAITTALNATTTVSVKQVKSKATDVDTLQSDLNTATQGLDQQSF